MANETSTSSNVQRGDRDGHLSALPLFRGLDSPTLVRLALRVSELSVPARELIYRRGQRCQGVHVVLRGQVKLVMATPRGAERVVDVVGPGGALGSAALFQSRTYAFDAEAIDDTRLMFIPGPAVLEELTRAPRLGVNLLDSLSRRTMQLIGTLEDCVLRTGAERVIGYLVKRLPEGVGEGRASVTLPAKKGVIASQLNLTQEHFSRILHDLGRDGLIEVRGRTVLLADVEALRARWRGSA
jgi:CRP-like cAMP-binding protein